MTEVTATFEVPRQFDLAGSFIMQRTGTGDPTASLDGARFSKASRTPEGLVAIELSHDRADGVVVARAWGDGARWTMARVPAWLGACASPDTFAPHGLVGQWAKLHAGLHLPRSPFPTDIHLSLVLQQRVSFRDAAAAHHKLARAYGEPAPGPLDLRVFPDHRALKRIPSYDYRALGIDSKRAHALLEAARLRERLAAMEGESFDQLRRFLMLIPGTGPWTTENLLASGFADPDAVPPGDVNLPHQVCFALAQEAFGSDARMFELLEPYRGQRARVVRLVWLAGPTRPYIDRDRRRRFTR